MYAAAAGKSKIGIPQEVGREFIAADRGKPVVRMKSKPKPIVRRR